MLSIRRTVVTCKLKSNSNETAKLLPAHARFHGLSPSPLKPRPQRAAIPESHRSLFASGQRRSLPDSTPRRETSRDQRQREAEGGRSRWWAPLPVH